MQPVFVMGLIIVLTIVLLVFGLSTLTKMFSNFQPGKNKIRKDLRKMKAELHPWVEELVPWDRNEMELLSTNQINRTQQKGIVNSVKGVFTSIYHEPMVAYAYKKYASTGSGAILYVRTSKHEFVYRFSNKYTEVYIDNQKIGMLTKDKKLYNTSGNKVIALIDQKNAELILPILVEGREIGSLLPAQQSKKGLNPRAFDMFSEKIDNDEEKVFLSLAILELVERSLK